MRCPRRGGKRGRSAVAARFSALSAGDWGYLVEQYMSDLVLEEERGQRRRGRQAEQRMEQDAQEKLYRKALSFIQHGQIGRGLARVTSHGVASASDPAVRAQLAEKYPPRFRPLPASVVKGQAIPSFSSIREVLQKLQRGVSAGSGGCKGEYLSLLGNQLDPEEMSLLETFAMAYIEARLPPWFYAVAQTSQTLPLYKSAEENEVRPLGLCHTLVKVMHKEVVSQNRTAFKEFLEPQQVILSPAGAAKMVFSVRAVLEERRDFICLSIDLKNAFNSMSRAACVETLESVESLRHLAQFFGVTMASSTPLESGGVEWGKGPEGATQGKPDAMAAFSATLQPSLVRFDEDLKAREGLAISGADDVNALGPPEVLLPAFAKFKAEVAERCGLELRVDKSKLFTWEGGLPPGCPADLPLAGEKVGDQFFRGFMCFGVPVGEDRYVSWKLQEIADRLLDEARQVQEVLSKNRQALWVSLRASIQQRFDYWCTLCRPSLVKPIASHLDKELWRILEAAVGCEVPRTDRLLDEGESFVITTPVSGLEARPFAEWVVKQPVRLHGAGLRSHADSCYPAFVGALEQVAGYMSCIGVLKEVIGGEETWGEDGDPGSRWAVLLASGAVDGRELRGAWSSMQQEARESAFYLGEEVEGVLGDNVEGAGQDSGGLLRQKLMEQVETMRGKVLLRALKLHPNREARPVWSFQDRDKLTSAWLLALPLLGSSLSNAEFSEAFAAMLNLASPACAGLVGQPVAGQARVCKYGDSVTSAHMRGDGFRLRHDAIKMKIKSLLQWAGVRAECEVFNEFSGLIPQQGLNRIQRGQRRQGLVPDFKLEGERGGEEQLCELKIMSASRSRYPRNPLPRDGVRAVDRRAAGLTADYLRKARNVDQQYCGTPAPPAPGPRGQQQPRAIGPVERHLLEFGEVKGWCFGAFGEASEGVHQLVERLAEARLEIAETQPNQRGLLRSRAAEKAGLVAYVRRSLSLVCVKEQAKLLLGRLRLLGDGAGEAARRRARATQLEVEAVRERQAQAIGFMQGRGIRRLGFGRLDM